MVQTKWLRLGLIALLMGIMLTGYGGFGGFCDKDSDDDDDTATGSSGTLPAQVTSPNPANGTIDISTDTGLTWASASGATSYNVYADDFNPPTTLVENTTETSIDGPPGGLNYLTTYYWRVNANNSAGTTTGIIWNFTTGMAPTYSISGNITYAGSKTGRIYINVMGETYCGTSISPTGTYTIRGVMPGSYVLTAYMEHIGQGVLNASNPISSTNGVIVTDSNLTNMDFTLTDPALPSAISPTGLAVIPGDESAIVAWEPTITTTVYGEERETAKSYNIYWDIADTVSKASYVASATAMALNDTYFLQTGLTNGQAYYYVVTAVFDDDSESDESDTFGPVTINPPAGGYTVSGDVSFPGAATGPLVVVLGSQTGMTFTAIASPTSPQSYSISGLANGTYYPMAMIDMNDNGVEDIGDISTISFGGEGVDSVTVAGAPVTKDITITDTNTFSCVGTEHFKSGVSESYGLDIPISQGKKLPVKVVLTAGLNLPVPTDIGKFPYDDGFMPGFDLGSIRPEVGDTYTFDVTYSDGTTETINRSVTGVLDCFAENLAPTGTGADTTPTFSWEAPSSPPASYTYWFEMVQADGAEIWEFPDGPVGMPSATTSIPYDFDGGASQPALVVGKTYNWEIYVADDNGNVATIEVSYTVE